ncbi:hypothetical protein Isop_2668 [Isosphaera pallida ATCC 43644]|uniref:Uncharacterized protein n=1 Tax=Isosphaera pallida (strain ATCC 43644 / DSM 9630 / IS1B) TaxID=575540 RepID=E8QZU7_ISOPI|nr:hypothetical protein Isop_2668 [Isosphaera pallida ATCC 43644]
MGLGVWSMVCVRRDARQPSYDPRIPERRSAARSSNAKRISELSSGRFTTPTKPSKRGKPWNQDRLGFMLRFHPIRRQLESNFQPPQPLIRRFGLSGVSLMACGTDFLRRSDISVCLTSHLMRNVA